MKISFAPGSMPPPPTGAPMREAPRVPFSSVLARAHAAPRAFVEAGLLRARSAPKNSGAPGERAHSALMTAGNDAARAEDGASRGANGAARSPAIDASSEHRLGLPRSGPAAWAAQPHVATAPAMSMQSAGAPKSDPSATELMRVRPETAPRVPTTVTRTQPSPTAGGGPAIALQVEAGRLKLVIGAQGLSDNEAARLEDAMAELARGFGLTLDDLIVNGAHQRQGGIDGDLPR